MVEQRFEILRREDGAPDARNTDAIEMIFCDDGALMIDGVYSGPAAKAFWGDWDHEFQLRVPTAHVQAFIAAVFETAFTLDRALKFGDLQRICKERNIPAEEWSWS